MLDHSRHPETRHRATDAPETGVYTLIAPHPFRLDNKLRIMPQGMTLREILRESQPEGVLREISTIYLNGEMVVRDRWEHVMPRQGDAVLIRCTPGRGDGGKSVLRTVLSIGVLIAGTVFGGPLGAAIGLGVGKVGLAVGTAIIAIGGTLLVNAIAPIRPPAGRDPEQESPSYFLDSARNTARPFAPIPLVLGKHRQVPPLGAEVYTEIIGNEHFLRMLLVWGYGPIELSEIKIGETPIAEFNVRDGDMQIEHRMGKAGEPALTLYTDDIHEDSLSILLQESDGWVSRTTNPNADEISVDLTLPRGLTQVDEMGHRGNATVAIQVSYRQVGSAAWLAPPVGSASRVSPPAQDQQQPQPETPREMFGAFGTFDDEFYTAPAVGNTKPIGVLTLTENKHSPIRHGFRWGVDTQGQYEVRLRRVTADSTSDRIFDEVYWSALRTITDRDPIAFRKPLARTALVIRASDQLHGSVDQLNAICSSIIPDWDGTNWVDRATSNPASMFRYVLQGPGRAHPFPDDQIDLEGLQRFHDFCRENSFEYNAIRDFSASVYDALRDICAAGRASPSFANGKWSVVVDDGEQLPVQHFSSANSRNITCQKAFDPVPEALRINFNNREMNWRRDERSVYQDNFDEDNANLYASIDAPGITDPEHIHKFGRFHLAQLILRPEIWTFEVDFEYLLAPRGSRIVLSNDVLLVGLAAGRIKRIITATENVMGVDVTYTTGVELDTRVSMDAAKNYGLVVRTIDNVARRERVQTVAGDSSILTLTNRILHANVLSVGDLVSFGEFERETIDGLVVGIESRDEFSASISVMPWSSPGVYNADTEPIPPYDSGLTPLPGRRPLVVVRVISDLSVAVLESGVFAPRISVEVEPSGDPDTLIECQIRSNGTSESWTDAEISGQTPESVTIADVEESRGYDLRLRWRSQGVLIPGPWTEVLNHVVIGRSATPPALEGMTIHEWGDNLVLIRWSPIAAADIRIGGQVRFRHSESTANPSWDNAVSIGTPVSRESYIILPLKGGAYLARVFDSFGRASDVRSVTISEARILTYTNVQTINEHPGFTGRKTSVRVSGGALILTTGSKAGTYEFANQVALEETKPLRVKSVISISGTPNTEAVVEFRTTEDDPATASASWTSWRPLETEQVIARGCQFRLRLTRSVVADVIRVTALGAVVEVPATTGGPDTRTPTTPLVRAFARGRVGQKWLLGFGVTPPDNVARSVIDFVEVQVAGPTNEAPEVGTSGFASPTQEIETSVVDLKTAIVDDFGVYWFIARSHSPLSDPEYSGWSNPVPTTTSDETSASVASKPILTARRIKHSDPNIALTIRRPEQGFESGWWYAVQVFSDDIDPLPVDTKFTTQIRAFAETGMGQVEVGGRTFTVAGATWTPNQWRGRVLYLYKSIDTSKGIVRLPLPYEIASNTENTITVKGDPFRVPIS